MRPLLVILLWLFNSIVFGQNVKLISSENLPKLKILESYKTDSELKEIKRSILFQLHNKGYLAASIDSSRITNKNTQLYIYRGAQFQWSKLIAKNIDEDALNYSGFKEKLFSNKTLSSVQHSRLVNRLLEYHENNGHPFTEVFLDSITAIDNQLSGQLVVRKNQQIKIDSIVIKSEEDINVILLQNVIDINQGELYSEKKMRLISNKILESGLFKETEKWQIIFSKESSKLYLFLKSDKASQFNGIAGVQPDPITNKISVTGDITLHLKNALKRAESIGIDWKKFGDVSQELQAEIAYPYLFQSQFGTELGIHLYKRDTSFLELEQKAEVQYLFSQTNVFKAFTKRYTSNTISDNLANSFTNISTIYYGLGLQKDKLNYRFNPLKGYYIDVSTSIGNKQTSDLDENDDLIETKSPQGLVEGTIGGYIPLGNKTTIKIGNSTRYIINDDVYENELFRFGGLKTMRGFDEESLSASFYSISTLELRYLFEQNSNAYLFIDGGFFERNTTETYQNNLPIGTGFGVNFETGAGIFTIGYALGKLENTNFQFRSAKIHFGFVAVF